MKMGEAVKMDPLKEFHEAVEEMHIRSARLATVEPELMESAVLEYHASFKRVGALYNMAKRSAQAS